MVDQEIGPETAALHSLLSQELTATLEHLLAPRECLMLRLHYGLHDGREYRQSDIADLFGLSRERVRQILLRATRKLRESSQIADLKDWL